MYTSEGNRLRAIENQLGEQQKLSWAMLLMGLTAGLVGMYFIVARPMSREIRTMKVELAQVQEQLGKLGVAGDKVWEANSLLSSLKLQETQLDDARNALQSVRQLTAEVSSEADRARAGIAQLKAVANLNQQIIQERPATETAGRVLGDMISLSDRLAARQEITIEASETLAQMVAIDDVLCDQTPRIEEAKSTARALTGLVEEIRQGIGGLNDALFGLHGLLTLQDTLIENAEKVESAQIVGEQMISLQQRLADEELTTEVAIERVRQLLDLNATLSRDDLDLQSSKANLDSLLQLQQTLGQLPSPAGLMDSLDVMVAFQNELVDQIQFLGEMRKSLIEIGLLEPALAKAIRALEPLLELGNLRRMSDEEIRSAARHILEERTTRLTGRPLDAADIQTKLPTETYIPNPTTEE